MSENYWWKGYGSFKPWSECPTRPDPGEVLLFYLAKRGIGPDEQVAYLSDLLELQKSMVYNILKGEGLDTISRCRLLVQALKIHPPLLGIDAKFYPIERHAYWWEDYGFSFNADAQGYPLISEVIACLRVNRMQEGGKNGKGWSQEDLGDATGLKKETVYRMEHDRNPLILENMGRRALVASALGTLAGDEEATIFHLFGLDPQAYGVPVSAEDVTLEVHDVPECLTDEILSDYQRTLSTFFKEFYAGHAQNLVEDAREWLRRVEALEPLAETCAQRFTLLALECRYHKLLAALLREQMEDPCVFAHMALAVQLAEQAMTLPNPQLGEHARLTLTNELMASALFWRADAYYECEEFILAQADIDRALDLLPTLQSSRLKMQILTEAGLIHAHTVQSEMDRVLVLSYFNRAAQMLAPGQRKPAFDSLDDHCMCIGPGLLYLRKAMALSTPQMRGTTVDSVRDLLENAQKVTSPQLLRQHSLIEIFLALDSFAAGDYRQAIDFALDALEKSRQLRSRPNRDRIEAFYQQLLQTKSREEPYCSYLGVKLRTWNHGMC